MAKLERLQKGFPDIGSRTIALHDAPSTAPASSRRPPHGALIPRKTSASRASENLCCRTLAPASVKLICLFACAYLAAATAAAQDAQALLHKYRCDLCHAAVGAKTGPAYAEVAQRYRGDPKAEAKLAAFVRKGAHGGGPWPMPPHPEVSAAEARKMARYILSVRD